ncbi:hypothetical protein Tco_1194993 [Tanacetum coccineum]
MQTTGWFLEAPAHQEFETGVQDEQAEEESVPAVHESVQPWLSNLAQQDPRESFDELTDSTFDFSAFVMNRLNVQTLTPELLAGPTFELMKGTCKSLTELEYFCEEVYKATTEKLDWINPEGRQYPHDLRQPLPLVPNSQGDFRLRIQDIEDMLLLLVQGKVTNLNVEERIAFNFSLRMFTRSVVIQRPVEDLQLGVESYQKKLNLTKPDTYRSNLRRRDAYTPYSDPRGFIYENKDKKNRFVGGRPYGEAKDKEDNEESGEICRDDHTAGDLTASSKGPYDYHMMRLGLSFQIHDPVQKPEGSTYPGMNPLVSVDVLRYDLKRIKSEKYGIMPTEMEQTLEQTQQSVIMNSRYALKGLEE